MAKPRQRMSSGKKTLYISFCLLLILGAGMFVFKLFSSDDLYVEAYRPRVEQANEYRRLEKEQAVEQASGDASDSEEQPSVEVRPFGFRERDIDKTHGNRYSTF